MRLMLFAIVLLVSACGNRVDCWYVTSYAQSIGEPWFAVHGRTPFMVKDIEGPMFKTQADMTTFITGQHLTMCASSGAK